MQNTKVSKILPSPYELIGLVFLSIAVILLGTSHQLLSYYGFSSSDDVIKGVAGAAVSHGLGKLDSFSFTDVAVTFLIWAVVGMFCFSVVRGIVAAYQEVQFDEELSSSKYVHPSTFTKAKFWHQVILEFGALIVTLVITAIFAFGLMAYVLPTAIAYSRTFLIGFALAEIGYMLLAIAILYVWLVFLDVCVRMLFHYRTLVD